MKITRNVIVLFCFVAVFVILLIVAAVQGTLFGPSLVKSIFVAVFFAGWSALLVFCIFTFVLPRIRDATRNSRNQTNQRRTTSPPPTEEVPRRSPRSDLPVRERISRYVEERRIEEGISAPTLLRPTRSTQVVPPAVSHITQSVNSTDELPGIDGDLDLAGMGPEGIVGADDSGLNDSFDLGDGDSGLNDSFDLGDGDSNLNDSFDLGDGDSNLNDSFDLGDGDSDLNDSLDSSGGDLPGFDGDLDDSFDDLEDVGGNSIATDDSDDEMESLDTSGFDDFDDIGGDSFDANGGDDLMAMDDAGMNDSLFNDSPMESDEDLPDFDGALDLPMDDDDLMLADNDFGDIEEIGDLEP
jgi:hypothetical protein